MKRSFRASISLLLSISALALLAPGAFAEGTADPNALLAFKKLFVEPIQDNVDGTYQAPITESYKHIFERNPRFELVADKSQADTIVRTVISKLPTGTQIDITLLLAATGEVFTAEHETVPTSVSGRDTGSKVEQLLKAALKRVPFYGTVTGRDGQELTFDIGTQHGLRKGDTIQISRIDSIKRHPLLKSIVDTQLVPVGDAIVDSAEETISFGHVGSEITGERIQKLNKVTAIEARVAEESDRPRALEPEMRMGAQGSRASNDRLTPASTTNAPEGSDADRPHLGYVGIGLQLSGLSSSNSQASTTTSVGGGGFSPGVRLEGELWFTKNWFADLELGFAGASFSSSSGGTGTSYSTSTHAFHITAGYKYLTEDNLYGPQIAVKIGYMNWGWSTPISAADLISSKSYSGFDLGLGGSLPISTYDWGILLDVNVMLFASITEDAGLKLLGNNPSSSGASFLLAGYHYFNRKLAVRAGPLIEVFSGNDDSGDSTSQKTFGVLASILYYF